MHRSKTIAILSSLLLLGLYGCAAPITMQSVSSTVPTVFGATGSGKGDSAWYARYDDVLQATLLAGEKLAFELDQEIVGAESSHLSFVDETGQRVSISIQRRTEYVTWVGFDVGTFGSTSLGRLMARQIIVEVENAGKFVGDWNPIEVN